MNAIREASTGDAAGIADLHVRSWRAAYPGILPAAYLATTIVEERHEYWRRMLDAPGPGDFVLLMPDDAEPLAFVSVLRDREPGYDAVIDNLHVQPAATGQGLGRRLLGAAVARLIGDGARSACLWVFDANRPTVRFYERLGGRAAGRGIDDFAGANAPHTRYGWHDLARLRERCG